MSARFEAERERETVRRMLRERWSLKHHRGRAYGAKDDPPAHSEYPVTWQTSLLELTGPQPPGGSPQRVLEARLSQEWDDRLQLTNGQRTLDVRSCRSLLDLDGTYETSTWIARPSVERRPSSFGRSPRGRAFSMISRSTHRPRTGSRLVLRSPSRRRMRSASLRPPLAASHGVPSRTCT
jgi:hypothetical protein